MEKAGPLPLQIRLISLVLVAAIYGCARTAPELPPDYLHNAGSPKTILSQVPPPIRAMTCKEINQDFKNLSLHDSRLETKIHSKRGKNQAAGYIAGVVFLPAILAVDNDKSTKSLLDQNQKHRDQLIFAQKAKGCSPKSTVTTPPTEEPSSITDRLIQLDSLFKHEIISKQEYEQQRKKILKDL